MRRHRRPAHDLRVAIDCLPMETRAAMIEGVDTDHIIVGAYTDRGGGACPMLAAHRHGGRTNYASFARAWDRYTRAGNSPRPASKRELRTLRTMLEASMALERRGATDLAQAIAEHEALSARTRVSEESAAAQTRREAIREAAESSKRERRAKRDTGERDRTKELRDKPGWAWLRPFRRLDEYEVAVAQLEQLDRERRELEEEAREREALVR